MPSPGGSLAMAASIWASASQRITSRALPIRTWIAIWGLRLRKRSTTRAA